MEQELDSVPDGQAGSGSLVLEELNRTSSSGRPSTPRSSSGLLQVFVAAIGDSTWRCDASASSTIEWL